MTKGLVRNFPKDVKLRSDAMDTVFKKAAGNLQEKIDYIDRCYLAGRIEPAEESFPGIVDDYFCECFGSSAAGPEIGILKNPYAIIALGGYGRGPFRGCGMLCRRAAEGGRRGEGDECRSEKRLPGNSTWKRPFP